MPAGDVSWRATRPKNKESETKLTRGLQPINESTQQLKALTSRDFGPTVFERESPRARATLRAFLCEFLVDDARGGVKIRSDIDLRKYSQEALRPVSNATVQEICVMQPEMTSLNVNCCEDVGDAALCAVSKHCKQLRVLYASECHRMTRIGLRALALGCVELTVLDLSRCTDVDDPALGAIAAGCANLKTLRLSGCEKITDDGLAVVARGCHNLQLLDVKDCRRVGEFGDRALLALGRYCADLTHLDMFGCAHVQDAGVIAVSRGCKKLTTFRLTGCREITGKALNALAKRCHLLKDLSLAGCKRLRDADICAFVGMNHDTKQRQHSLSASKSVARETGCRKLTRLDLSECDEVRARGLAALGRQCRDLRELTLRACVSVGDDACLELAHYASRLRSLDLSYCPLVSEAGIGGLARRVKTISRLDVSGSTRISMKFLIKLVDELRYCDLATDYYGLQPKPNADELRRAFELSMLRRLKATQIESLWRGALARVGIRSVKRRLFVVKSVTNLQSATRGYFERRRVAEITLTRREYMAATWFAAAWRGAIVRRDVAKVHKARALLAKHASYSLIIQRYYRAHLGRLRMSAFRAAIDLAGMQAARIRARQEVSATKIHSRWRGIKARTVANDLRRARDEALARQLLELRSAVKVARICRGRRGRLEARRRRAALAHDLFRWQCARVVQRVVRGMFGRILARQARIAARERRRHGAAVKIQGCWRANRARVLATMAAAVAARHMQEEISIKLIQSSMRTHLAQRRANSIRKQRALSEARERAVVLIQRVMRGHLGRTDWEIAKELDGLKESAAPLQKRLEVLLEESRRANADRDETQKRLDEYVRETKNTEMELREVSRVGHPYWDTSRLNRGYPQRYVTQYLKERLVEVLKDHQARVAELTDLSRVTAIEAREKERLIRQVRRELAPLTDGLAERTRKQRIERLRYRVRAERWASTKIQALIRSKDVQRAFDSLRTGGPGQWELLTDSFTGEDYYWNSINGRTRWSRPLEMDLPYLVHDDSTVQPGYSNYKNSSSHDREASNYY